MTPWYPPQVVVETVPCAHCGHIEEREIMVGPDRLHEQPGVFRVAACPHCGWLRQNPRPDAESLSFYYPPEYPNYVGAIEDEAGRLRKWDRRYGMLKRRWAIERLHPRGRLLDVGCATGTFLSEMKRAGWQAEGVEPNPRAREYARSRHGLNVYPGTLEEANLAAGTYDVVTFWDVLEHVADPWADLQRASQLLRRGGLLVIRVPNMESLEARWFGRYWIGWDLPRHLYFFPRHALKSALNELGFAIEREACLASGHSAFMLSLRFLFQDRYPPAARLSKLILRYGYSAPARLALAPAFWVLDQTRLACMVTLFARKTGGAMAGS